MSDFLIWLGSEELHNFATGFGALLGGAGAIGIGFVGWFQIPKIGKSKSDDIVRDYAVFTYRLFQKVMASTEGITLQYVDDDEQIVDLLLSKFGYKKGDGDVYERLKETAMRILDDMIQEGMMQEVDENGYIWRIGKDARGKRIKTLVRKV